MDSDRDSLDELTPDTFMLVNEVMDEIEAKKRSEAMHFPGLPEDDVDSLTTKFSAVMSENWNVSSFWFDKNTCEYLSQEAVRAVGDNGSIALVSCPSLYTPIKIITPTTVVKLFEYDERFGMYGDDFIYYDYNVPLDVPRTLKKFFDLVIADPPFLSKECLAKTSETINFLANDKIILCSGAVMGDLAMELLDVQRTDFKPGHCNNLGYEVWCYKNYAD